MNGLGWKGPKSHGQGHLPPSRGAPTPVQPRTLRDAQVWMGSHEMALQDRHGSFSSLYSFLRCELGCGKGPWGNPSAGNSRHSAWGGFRSWNKNEHGALSPLCKHSSSPSRSCLSIPAQLILGVRAPTASASFLVAHHEEKILAIELRASPMCPKSGAGSLFCLGTRDSHQLGWESQGCVVRMGGINHTATTPHHILL